MMKRLFILLQLLFVCLGLSSFSYSEEKKDAKPIIISLHPILSDIVKQLAGDKVELIDFLKPNGNLHSFEPSPQDIRHLSKATLILASGKDIEPYLHKLQDNLSSPDKLINVGKSIPDVAVTAENAAASCCGEDHSEPEHAHDDTCNHGEEKEHEHSDSCDHERDTEDHSNCNHLNDPHWWHSADNMVLASQTIADALKKVLPSEEKSIQQKADSLQKEYKQLKVWAKRTLKSIPKDQRILVTGHAAFSHLCQELDFTPIAVQGIARQDEGTAQYLASIIKRLKDNKVTVIFPEYSANPKALDELAKTTKATLAKPLVSDGLAPHAHQFPAMYRANVQTMADALAPKKKKSNDAH